MSRVLVVGCWDESAGIPRTESLVAALLGLGHEVEECYVDASDAATELARRVGTRLVPWAARVGAPRRTRARVRAAVRAALARGPLDMVLVPYPGALTVSCVRSVYDGPIVLDLFRASGGHLATDVQPDGIGPHAAVRADRAACRAADLVIVDTHVQAEHVARLTGLPRTRFGVVPICDPDGPVGSPVPGLGKGEPLRLLLFGKGLPSAGLATWVEAVRRSPSTSLQLVGGDASTHRVVKAALGHRADVIAEFLPMNQLRERIVAAHVVGGVVDPSREVARTVPYRVVHALAHGRPVITAKTEALRDLLTPGVDSVTVPMADAGETALALERLARDPSGLAASGEAARATYDACFSPDVVVGRLEELLGSRLGFRSMPWSRPQQDARALEPAG